jgi:hypothetical protein
MRGRILNINADGTWQTLGPAQNFPENTYMVTIQARNNSNAAAWKFAGQVEYMTIRAGGSVQLKGKFDPGDIQVQGTDGDVIEIECDTQLTLIRR